MHQYTCFKVGATSYFHKRTNGKAGPKTHIFMAQAYVTELSRALGCLKTDLEADTHTSEEYDEIKKELGCSIATINKYKKKLLVQEKESSRVQKELRKENNSLRLKCKELTHANQQLQEQITIAKEHASRELKANQKKSAKANKRIAKLKADNMHQKLRMDIFDAEMMFVKDDADYEQDIHTLQMKIKSMAEVIKGVTVSAKRHQRSFITTKRLAQNKQHEVVTLRKREETLMGIISALREQGEQERRELYAEGAMIGFEGATPAELQLVFAKVYRPYGKHRMSVKDIRCKIIEELRTNGIPR